MIITEKQLMCLIDVLKDSLLGVPAEEQFSITLKQRRELYEIIVNQQSSELKEIK